MSHRLSCFALAAVLCAPTIANAQTTPVARGDVFSGGYAATSFFTNGGPHFALLRNRKVVMLGMRRERVYHVGPRVAWATTFDIPISIILPKDDAPSAECWWRSITKRRECYEVLQPGMPVGAIGLTPLGIKASLGLSARTRLFGSLAAGVVAFDRKTPVEQASAVNFSAEYLLGTDIGIGRGQRMEIAWKFQHWSNANLSHFNPGLDANLITVGFKGRR